MAATTNPAPDLESASRPRFFDYLFLWFGVALSALFADMTGLRTVLPNSTPGPATQALLRVLPTLLFLPIGIILFWPVFFATQWLCGRTQGLTAGEWLLGLAWLGSVAFTVWCVGKGMGSLPEFFTDADFKKYVVLGYILFILSMGALALVLWTIGLVARWRQPWTHTLSLTLMIWPALPLLMVWLRSIKLE